MKLGPALRNLLLVAIPTLVACFAAAEVVFRTVIPACQAPLVRFDRESGTMRFDVRSRRDGVFTFGRFARHRARWHINNEGWNCAADYEPAAARGRPAIAIIGDSFVEGLHVDVDRHMDAVLRSLTGSTHDVYAFGISGAPLSQYLHMSRYVVRRFDPEVLVFLVVQNDFTESIRALQPRTRMMQLDLEPERIVEIEPEEYRPNVWRRRMGRSAVVRFCVLNAKLPALMAGGGGDAAVDELDLAAAHRDEIRRATRYVVGRIRDENPARRILFAMVPERMDAGGGRRDGARVAWLEDLVRESAVEFDCRFVDLEEPFQSRLRADGVRFDFEEDPHWNATGHETAARAIHAELRAAGMLDPRPGGARSDTLSSP